MSSRLMPRQWHTSPKMGLFRQVSNTSAYGEIEPRNIESTFQIKNYYTVLSEEKPSDAVERKFYGALDDYTAKLLVEIEDTFNAGRIPVFHGDVLASLQNLVFHFLKRTPDFVSDFDEVALGRQYAEEAANLWARDGNPHRERRYLNAMGDDRELRRLGRDVRVRAEISPPSTNIELALRRLKVRWGVAGGRGSLILSSRIGYRVGNGGSNGLINPQMEIWMPISPKRVLILLRDDASRIPILNELSLEKIREVNEFAMSNSRAVASHSDDLLRSLLKRGRGKAKLQA